MAFTLGIFLAFGALICWAVGDFLIQRSTRKVGNVETLAVIGIVGSIILIPFVIKDFYLLFDTYNIVFLSLLGTLTFVTAILQFQGLKEGKLSIIDVLMEIELPVTVILSFIFLRESLSSIQLFLIVVGLIGMILIATKSFHHYLQRLERGAWLALASAVVMGAVNFMTGSGSKSISPLLAIWFPWVVFSILCLVVIAKRKSWKEFGHNIKSYTYLLLIMGLVDTAAWIFYAFATQNDAISIITAITECYPALAMFLGLWLNKESIRWHQYLGAFLALGGCIALALSV
jgi:bacterial/archaeal transporter family protein